MITLEWKTVLFNFFPIYFYNDQDIIYTIYNTDPIKFNII